MPFKDRQAATLEGMPWDCPAKCAKVGPCPAIPLQAQMAGIRQCHALG